MLAAGATLSAFGAEGGDAATTNAPEPQIQFADPDYDFGRINSGESVKHTFVFTNTGNAKLEISAVHPSCGCTTAGEWTKEVAPGQTGSIPVQFNSGSYGGVVHKTVTVTSNAKNQPSMVLQLHGNIWKAVDVNPQYAVLQVNSESVSNSTVSVHVVNNTDQPFTLTNPVSNNKGIAAEIKSVKEDKEYEVVVRTVPPFDPANTQGLITMQSTLSNAPTVTVTVLVIMQPSIVVSPDRVVLPAGKLAEQTTSTVLIRNQLKAPLKLSDAQLNSKAVKFEVKETEPGVAFTINFTFPAGFEFPAEGGLELTVKTSNERTPLIKIPLSAAAEHAAAGAPTVTLSPRALSTLPSPQSK